MREFLEHQYQNLFLWSPFVMAFGAALYFTFPFEPNISFPLLIAGLSMAIIIFKKPSIILTTILLFVFGFFYAAGFTRLIDTSQMSHNLRDADITGIVKNIDYTSDKTKIFVQTPDVTENKYALIRVSLDKDDLVPKIGDKINARVTLFKPSGADAPNSFDYARWAYFNGITATGYLNGFNEIPISNENSFGINNIRNYLHNKTNSMLSDTLVLGYKNAVPKSDSISWFAIGVGHIWSISGFHMTLVSAWLFGLFYLIFRSIAPITRRIPARYPAMIFAWFGLLFYLFLSGIDVATIRAFLMTTLIFVAFIFGRNAFSLRNVCIAFITIFLLNPHYIMQPGFQLSFSAIFGLVWFFDENDYKKLSPIKKIIRIFRAAIMTSIIATLFTAPFVAATFYSLPIYSLVGNLLILPIFSLAIMPLVIIGTIGSIFGFKMPLIWSDRIYDWTLVIANKIAALPFAQVQIPEIKTSALFLIIIGFLCLMFIKNYNKIKFNIILFFMFLISGITIIALNKKPIFYATSDHELVAIVRDKKLEFNKARASNHFFAFDSWKQLNFEPIGTPNKKRKCTKGVCIYKTPNWTLAYAQKYIPLSQNIVEFCHNPKIDFIVSYFDIESEKCDKKIIRGGFVIYESGIIKHTPSNRWWDTRH